MTEPPDHPPAAPPPDGAEPRRRDPWGARGRREARGPRPPRPPRPPVDPERVRVTTRRVTTFALLVVAALIASTLPLPWQLGGLAFVLAAIVAGIAALRAARGSGVREQVAPLVIVGLVFTVLMGLSMSTVLLLWSAQTARQECLENAVTIGAREECERRYEEDVRTRLEELSGRASD